MVNPTRGEIITSREKDGMNDDILGAFRVNFSDLVQATIQYHNQNIKTLTGGAEVYKAYVFDPINPSSTGDVIPSPPNSDFAAAREVANITAAFDGPTVTLPNDGQVPQEPGQLIKGQAPFASVNQTSPGTIMSTIRADSVAGVVANFTSLLSKVRVAKLAVRQVVSAIGDGQRSWPKYWGDVVFNSNEEIINYPQFYTYSVRQNITGIGHFAAPYFSVPPYVAQLNTTIQDMLAGPDNAKIVEAARLIMVFERMKVLYDQAKATPVYAVVDYCHSSCHFSCHSSRSRR